MITPQNIKTISRVVGVFVLFFAVFLAAQLAIEGFFSIDDPYYHAKHSYLMAQSGDYTLTEPWLKFNFLNFAPTDPWWGYHLLQAFFIKYFGIVLGAKIVAGLAAALVPSVFYFILSDFKVKKPFLWTMFFVLSSSFFLARLLYARPMVLAMSAVPLHYWMMARRRRQSLFFLSALYALAYNLFPMVILSSLVFTVSGYLAEKKADFKPFAYTLAGVLLGIVLHPQSLNYIYVVFVHHFLVVFLRLFGTDLGTGAEVQTMGFSATLKVSVAAIAAYLLSVAAFSLENVRAEAKKYQVHFLLVWSVFWGIVYLIVPRGVEYWLPAGMIFAAVMASSLAKTGEAAAIRAFWQKTTNVPIVKFFAYAVILILIGNNISTVAMGVYDAKKDTTGTLLAEANIWLTDNTEDESVVYYDNWSMWPMMFFYNDHNRYLLGMDPTFAYDYDKRLFWIWHNLSKNGDYCDRDESKSPCFGSVREDLGRIKYAVKQELGSDYVLLNNDSRMPVYKTINGLEDDFKKVFENEGFVIYEVL